MHNIKSNFGIIHRICKQIFDKEADRLGNFQFYPRKPVLSDIQVVALSCLMEALSIDSENLMWSKLKTDYPGLFKNLICRTRFNRRRKRLSAYIERVQEKIAGLLQDQSKIMVIDSVPVPVVKLAREKTYRAFRKDFETAPAKGFSAVNKGWFIGYKLHVVIYDNGVVQQSAITKGNIHDINFLKSLKHLPNGKQLLGDRAYRSNLVQIDLFDKFDVKLKVPFIINQHDYKKNPKRLKSKRQMIETFLPKCVISLTLGEILPKAMRAW
jgi:hypothetical protein